MRLLLLLALPHALALRTAGAGAAGSRPTEASKATVLVEGVIQRQERLRENGYASALAAGSRSTCASVPTVAFKPVRPAGSNPNLSPSPSANPNPNTNPNPTQTGLAPQTSRPWTDLLLTRLSLALDREFGKKKNTAKLLPLALPHHAQ
eukprot:scaffold80944_cov53-Phaeocystis_antarctica.AAC.2